MTMLIVDFTCVTSNHVQGYWIGCRESLLLSIVHMLSFERVEKGIYCLFRQRVCGGLVWQAYCL